jgi:methylenetetrahydrofolate--tRNA-(uracil-5-)-methyltransferase
MKEKPRIYFAGQIMGVEGYVESAASGMWAGINAARKALGEPAIEPDDETMTGALIACCTDNDTENLQPMNANYGIISPLGEKVRGKKERRAALSERALGKTKRILLDIERH